MGVTSNRVYRRFESTTNQLVKGGLIVIVWMEWLLSLPDTHQICPKCGVIIPTDKMTCAICGLSKVPQEQHLNK